MTTATTVLPDRRLDSRDGGQPPQWAVRATHLITVLMLPSGLWRVGVALGFSMGIRVASGVAAASGFVRGWGVVYILGLTAVSEGVGGALLLLVALRQFRSRPEATTRRRCRSGWVPLTSSSR